MVWPSRFVDWLAGQSFCRRAGGGLFDSVPSCCGSDIAGTDQGDDLEMNSPPFAFDWRRRILSMVELKSMIL